MKVFFWPVAVVALMALNPISCGSKSSSDDAPAVSGPLVPLNEPSPTPSQAAKVVFSDILPIFEAKCMKCHQPTSKRPLDKSSMIWTTGKTREQILAAIKTTVGAGTMPPKNQPVLTDDEKAKVIKWVDDGALD